MLVDSRSRAEWKVRLIAFLRRHLKGGEAKRSGAINAVLMALNTAHGERLRHAGRFYREIGAHAHRPGEIANAPAESIEAIADRVDANAVEEARRWQGEP